MEPAPSRVPVRTSIQWSTEQHRWLQARAARLGASSLAQVVRMIVQEAMAAEYRATTTDADTEEG